MPETQKRLYLATYFDAKGLETARLIKATTASAAKKHVFHLCVANPQNVADVLGAGGKIEEAAE